MTDIYPTAHAAPVIRRKIKEPETEHQVVVRAMSAVPEDGLIIYNGSPAKPEYLFEINASITANGHVRGDNVKSRRWFDPIVSYTPESWSADGWAPTINNSLAVHSIPAENTELVLNSAGRQAVRLEQEEILAPNPSYHSLHLMFAINLKANRLIEGSYISLGSCVLWLSGTTIRLVGQSGTASVILPMAITLPDQLTIAVSGNNDESDLMVCLTPTSIYRSSATIDFASANAMDFGIRGISGHINEIGWWETESVDPRAILTALANDHGGNA